MCKQYSNSWKVLKEAIKNYGGSGEMQKDRESFKQIKADICKFLMEKCLLEGEEFLDEEGELACLPKYEKLRKWKTLLRPTDYVYRLEF